MKTKLELRNNNNALLRRLQRKINAKNIKPVSEETLSQSLFKRGMKRESSFLKDKDDFILTKKRTRLSLYDKR